MSHKHNENGGVHATNRLTLSSHIPLMGTARDSELMIAFGNRIKQLRAKHNMSQYELAAAASVERSSIARIERGSVNPSLCTLKLLANAFDLSLSELLDF